jgi:hypothetical protein
VRRAPLLVALTTSALVVAGCGIDDPYQGDAATTSTTQTTTVIDRRSTYSTTPAPLTSADAREVQPDLSPAQASARRDAESVARRFLAGYLPYSYGRRPGSAIRAATPALRRDLARNPPRVSAARARGARPRVEQLRATGGTSERVFVLAQISDRRSRYATSLTVVWRHGGWLVSEVR